MDGLVVSTAEGDRVFTLSGADLPYRVMVETMNEGAVTLASDGTILFCNQRFADIVKGSLEKVIGSSIYRYISSTDLQLFKALFERGLKGNSKGELTLQTGGDNPASVLLSISALEHTDMPGAVCAVMVDITERKQTEENLKVTNTLLSLFTRKPSRKEYLDAVVSLIHSWSGCRCVGIRILDDKGYIPYESYLGFSREFWESESRLSIEHAQCVCMRDITGNPDPQDASMMTPGGSFHCEDTGAFVARLSAKEQARFRGVCIQNGFLSLSIVPIRYGKKILGSIQVADNEKKRVPLPLIEFLESMSPLIGEAINRFNLEDEIRESESHLRLLSSQLLTVQEDERKRISAELHDDIAAKLAGIKFVLEKKLMQSDKANDEANQSLKGFISMLRDTIASTRRIMINLRPAMIDDMGILATLNWYSREFEQIFSPIQVEKQINIKEIEIPDHLKIIIFRILQEAMNNISKHSGADHVYLSLQRINDTLALSIEDNGRGFDVEKKTLKSETFQGFGMVNMKERARLSGGDFAIHSLKEKGTFLKVTWPLKPIALDYHLRIEPS
ncbi:MAG: histidine kinase [Thermodesulfobacteriota bacterium]|nr:MAG: histidine kinase [Thermodesulfobacteriota bacterium]